MIFAFCICHFYFHPLTAFDEYTRLLQKKEKYMYNAPQNKTAPFYKTG